MDELDRIIAERTYDCLHKTWTKLHHACDLGLTEQTELLIAAGADINARTLDKGYTPLYIACARSESLGCIKLLIDAGADVNSASVDIGTPLHAACGRDGSLTCVELLLAAGAEVNAQNFKGWTPLHFACVSEDKQLVQALLEAGADPSIRANWGRLPLDLTYRVEIKDLIENFGLGGGRATKAAQ